MSYTVWSYANLGGNIVLVLFNAYLAVAIASGSELGAHWALPGFFAAFHIACAAYWVWAINDDRRNA